MQKKLIQITFIGKFKVILKTRPGKVSRVGDIIKSFILDLVQTGIFYSYKHHVGVKTL
jgi:hypothetical protein